jgi:succinate dehydrogenase / fumarate reductase, cytochrome b subunit
MGTTVSAPAPLRASLGAANAERLRRIFSITGVAPLGVFLVAHVIVNSYALGGEGAFAAAEDAIAAIPGLALVEALFVYLPLAVHAALGLWIWIAGVPAPARAAYPAAVRAGLRWTGAALFVFLVWHVASLRLRGHAHIDGGTLSTVLVNDLSSTWRGIPWRGVGYLVGAGCAAFHFVAGAWGVFASTELGRSSASSRRVAAWGAGLAGAFLWLVLADVVVFHATGARIAGDSVIDPPSIETCP